MMSFETGETIDCSVFLSDLLIDKTPPSITLGRSQRPVERLSHQHEFIHLRCTVAFSKIAHACALFNGLFFIYL